MVCAQSIQGKWLTTSTSRGNEHLFEFNNEFSRIEIDGRGESISMPYTIRNNQLRIFDTNLDTVVFTIKHLTDDSLTLVAKNKISSNYLVHLNGVGKGPDLHLYNSKLSYEEILFDSIIYRRNSFANEGTAYYSPTQFIQIVISSSGTVRYLLNTIDTTYLFNRKRINFGKDQLDFINSSGKLSVEQFAKLRLLINTSNIDRIDTSRDFSRYGRKGFHSSPSTLTVFSGGVKIYSISAVDFPWTMRPLIFFLNSINEEIAR